MYFNCTYVGTNEIPWWVINNTHYNWRVIGNDANYDLIPYEKGFGLYIRKTKLWMNNTEYSCYFDSEMHQSKIGTLGINFGKFLWILSS